MLLKSKSSTFFCSPASSLVTDPWAAVGAALGLKPTLSSWCCPAALKVHWLTVSLSYCLTVSQSHCLRTTSRALWRGACTSVRVCVCAVSQVIVPLHLVNVGQCLKVFVRVCVCVPTPASSLQCYTRAPRILTTCPHFFLHQGQPVHIWLKW